MKLTQRLIHLLLCLNLLVSVGGVPVVIHSCGGMIESVHVFAFSAKCEDPDGTSSCEDEGCCDNTVAIAQWQFDGVPLNSILLPTQQVVCVLPPAVQLPSPLLEPDQTSPVFEADSGERPPPPEIMSMRC